MIIRNKQYSMGLSSFYRELRETRLYFVKGRFSISMAQVINITLFFLCFSSCGRSNAMGLKPQEKRDQIHAAGSTKSRIYNPSLEFQADKRKHP